MEGSSAAAVHARLAAVMEALVLAAVAELRKLLEAGWRRPGAAGGPLLAEPRDAVVRTVASVSTRASLDADPDP